MTVKILSFGIAREITGGRELAMELPEGTDTLALRKIINQKYPALDRIAVYALAVNQVYVNENVHLNPNDVVAIIPPVSGG